MAGYSKRSLVEKLGIRPGHKVYIGNAPPDYMKTLGRLPEKVVLAKPLNGTVDFIQFFSQEKAELQSEFPRLKKKLAKDGTLWVSWPKGASKIKTDLNENVAREIGLKNGMVDVKVCAVDDVWSGLKFVYRLKDR
jgi:hypothetical protein